MKRTLLFRASLASLACLTLAFGKAAENGQGETNKTASATAPSAAETPASSPKTGPGTNAVPASPGATNAPAVSLPKAVVAPVPSPLSLDSTNRNIRFNFKDMPYTEVLERFAQMAGKPLIRDIQIEGTLTFSDPRPYTYAEALDTLNLILAGKKAMLVEAGRFLRVIPVEDISKTGVPIFPSPEAAAKARPGEVVTVVLQLKNLDPGEVLQPITAMLSKVGSASQLSRAKGIIITDRAENIRRIRDLIQQIDVNTPIKREMKIYKLRNVSGQLLVDMIKRTFGEATAPRRTIYNQRRQRYETLPPDPTDYVTPIYAEASNSLILFGPSERISLAEELITQFEKEGGAQASEIRVFYPQMKADQLAQMIRDALPNVASPRDRSSQAAVKAKVISDPSSNRLIVTAPAAGQLEAITKLIQTLDPSTQETQPLARTNAPKRPRSAETARAAKPSPPPGSCPTPPARSSSFREPPRSWTS